MPWIRRRELVSLGVVGALGVSGQGVEPFPEAVELGALDGAAGFTVASLAFFDFFGESVASAGDVNADGFGDIVIGLPEDAWWPAVGGVWGRGAASWRLRGTGPTVSCSTGRGVTGMFGTTAGRRWRRPVM